MKTVNLCLVVSCGLGTALAASGCLQDYDQFEFGGGGAPATTSAETTGPGPVTTGTGQTNTTVTSTVGPTTTNTTNTTNTTAQTTTASTTMASTSSGPIGPTVDCDGNTCDIGAGETCCIDGSQNGACTQGSCGNDIPVTCDEQADCGGQICCLFEDGSGTLSVECASDCSGADEDPICGGAADPACANPTICEPAPELPAGWESCQF
jgi:hypothetical protein